MSCARHNIALSCYPVDADETYEFLTDTHIDFTDSTTVILAGRHIRLMTAQPSFQSSKVVE